MLLPTPSFNVIFILAIKDIFWVFTLHHLLKTTSSLFLLWKRFERKWTENTKINAVSHLDTRANALTGSGVGLTGSVWSMPSCTGSFILTTRGVCRQREEKGEEKIEPLNLELPSFSSCPAQTMLNNLQNAWKETMQTGFSGQCKNNREFMRIEKFWEEEEKKNAVP